LCIATTVGRPSSTLSRLSFASIATGNSGEFRGSSLLRSSCRRFVATLTESRWAMLLHWFDLFRGWLILAGCARVSFLRFFHWFFVSWFFRCCSASSTDRQAASPACLRSRTNRLRAGVRAVLAALVVGFSCQKDGTLGKGVAENVAGNSFHAY